MVNLDDFLISEKNMDTRKEVLLVEDNENDAELTLRALRRQNMNENVMHLRDGEEALDYIFGKGVFTNRDKNVLPRFVILDIKLPRKSGLDVLKEIRSNRNTRCMPVIMLTSSNEDKDKVESYKNGANSYVVKPVDFDKFMKDIEKVGNYWFSLNKQPYK
jgi:DNA-binding response OmpR family regulator